MRTLGFLLLTVMLLGGCDDGSGPEIMPLEDRRVNVNDTLLVELRVMEEVGDEVWTFSAPSVEDIDRHATLYQAGGTATFRWAPLASHASPVPHQFTFTVEADGETDSETINVEVIQAGGAPRFIQPPPGGTYKLSENPEVSVDIEVIDEDTINVSITEREPLIQFGNISQDEGHRARWTWTPTQEQIDASLRYTLNLEASDGEHEPVRQSYDIVLITEGKDDCPGTPPSITVSAEEKYETIQDYEIRATITDDQRLRDLPVLYYSTDQPDMTNPQVTRMTQVTATKVAADEYTAFIPNLNLPEPGEERTMYFVWSATDNDDAESTACDLTTVSEVGQFTAVEPATPDTVGYCTSCSADRQCEDGLCVVAEPSFCGTACGEGCAEGSCQEITSRGGSTDQQCVPDELSCGGGSTFECTPEATDEANNEMASATPITLSTAVHGTICENDVDFYTISLSDDTSYVFTATGWDAATTDIDILIIEEDGDWRDWAATADAIESVELCPFTSGVHYIEVIGYDATLDTGPYSLEVTLGAAECAPECLPDSHEENGTPETATAITCGTGVTARICPRDEDLFELTVTEPSTLNATIACTEGGGDIDLYIYDSEMSGIGDAGTSMECAETASATLPGAGTYYMKVKGYEGSSAEYTLSCELSGGGSCSDTSECPSGNICDPSEGCISDFCDDPGLATECPESHFCPEPGGTATASACVDNCFTSIECRPGYACKGYEGEIGRGCGIEGAGLTGQGCDGFWECAGERTCLTSGSTGYCAEVGCITNLDCPTDDTHAGAPSRCVDVGGFNYVCLMNCLMDDELCGEGTCTWTQDVAGGDVWVCVLDSHTVE